MNFLTLDEVIAIHERMIAIGGGRIEIHDFTLLHSAIERPKAQFGGKYLYETIWHMAAALLHSLVKNHPFDDGNKRIAYFSTMRFLYINNYVLQAEQEKFIPFMIEVNIKNLSLNEIALWLKKHSKYLVKESK
jgi:death-on-curing protein